jgi:hypothetical protein
LLVPLHWWPRRPSPVVHFFITCALYEYEPFSYRLGLRPLFTPHALPPHSWDHSQLVFVASLAGVFCSIHVGVFSWLFHVGGDMGSCLFVSPGLGSYHAAWGVAGMIFPWSWHIFRMFTLTRSNYEFGTLFTLVLFAYSLDPLQHAVSTVFPCFHDLTCSKASFLCN